MARASRSRCARRAGSIDPRRPSCGSTTAVACRGPVGASETWRPPKRAGAGATVRRDDGEGRDWSTQSDRPLYALLSAALVAFTIECDNEVERRLSDQGYDEM